MGVRTIRHCAPSGPRRRRPSSVTSGSLVQEVSCPDRQVVHPVYAVSPALPTRETTPPTRLCPVHRDTTLARPTPPDHPPPFLTTPATLCAGQALNLPNDAHPVPKVDHLLPRQIRPANPTVRSTGRGARQGQQRRRGRGAAGDGFRSSRLRTVRRTPRHAPPERILRAQPLDRGFTPWSSRGRTPRGAVNPTVRGTRWGEGADGQAGRVDGRAGGDGGVRVWLGWGRTSGWGDLGCNAGGGVGRRRGETTTERPG